MNIFDLVIVQPIFNMLMGLYSLIPGGDFGIVIVIFTILVRFALWPLVKKQLHQTKAMQKMQPELAKIKVAAKGNKQVESLQMMELYKKHDIHPFQSILVLMIQLPIFIALFQVIKILTSNRDLVAKYTYDFLENVGPIKALINHPDQFNENFLGFINLAQQAIASNPFAIHFAILALAIISAVTQYFMTKQTMPQKKNKKTFKQLMSEAANGKEPDQSEMTAVMSGSMMKFMPIMMFIIMINMPGALVLYYMVSNIAALVQQNHILKKDTEEMIEIADEQPVISQHKKATAKAREKQAREANVIRIKAKDNTPKSNKKEKI